MLLLDGREVSKQIIMSLKEEIEEYQKKGLRKPSLAVILVGEDPASKIYVRRKREASEKVGINSICINLPSSISQEDLVQEIKRLNDDDSIDGILVQLPLPTHIDTGEVIQAIKPDKDVDGFHPENVGRLATGIGRGIVPCTPLGIWLLLKHYKIDAFGKDVVIVGASNIVGKPMSLVFLKDERATVTVCHKNTRDLKSHTSQADILVVAVGKPKLITRDMVKEGSVVIDVGINRLENGKIVGDVDFENVKDKVYAITPVPGGVGPMTVVSLLVNTLHLYRLKHGFPPHLFAQI
ncbi:MAG: bifunctional methylenetetrahydrofolate dehydrogenase/methenyltetrahydrofolate cyclohydrolase FolD [Aquificae bacterium]|nr:bifunctional methylenetetrahydrofolate dehydrogenase/methenyltetrahydrofolate cyclohydrolase FolD [Aquificota bacterium]